MKIFIGIIICSSFALAQVKDVKELNQILTQRIAIEDSILNVTSGQILNLPDAAIMKQIASQARDSYTRRQVYLDILSVIRDAKQDSTYTRQKKLNKE